MQAISRKILFSVAVGVFAVSAVSASDGAPFTFERLSKQAALLANSPFQEWRRPPAPALKKLTYDQYRDIRFNPAKSIWGDTSSPFRLQLFHPGWIQDDQVDIHLLEEGHVRDIPYDSFYFTFGPGVTEDVTGGDMKFAGFRVHYPLNSSKYFDELVVFQGATYFRALAKGSAYGLCARTVAVNCGGPGPEEFPRFREFWIERPRNIWYDPLKLNLFWAPTIRVLGLFDGPSVAGAAEFFITPGSPTVMRCRVSMSARRHIPHLGVAPITSMFWYGPQSRRRFEDFRPQVHDSDGLLICNGAGEWIWRPLVDRYETRICSFLDQSTTKGFGLIQRERRFAAYEDLEARYQDRPSTWVIPSGDWGAGSVRLLEIPTENEFGDNIVAFWEPERPLEAGETREFSYELRWFQTDDSLPPTGHVVATRIADMADPEDVPLITDGKTALRKFVLDFTWNGIGSEQTRRDLDVEVRTGAATLVGHPVQQFNEPDGTWRVFFKVKAPKGSDATDLSLVLRRKGRPVTEKWTYLWRP